MLTASPSQNPSLGQVGYTGSPPGAPGSRRASLPLDGSDSACECGKKEGKKLNHQGVSRRTPQPLPDSAHVKL